MCWFRLQLPVRFLGERLRLSRRLAGLLSGYLPTDTRPQARAKLGKDRNNGIVARVNTFARARRRSDKKFCRRALTGTLQSVRRGAEVFGAAFAAGWAFAILFDLGEYGVHILQAVFFLIGIAVMVRFIINARRVEPFTRR